MIEYFFQICDSDCKILNINAKYGGATHDAFVWENSVANQYMQQLHTTTELVWLLGINNLILIICTYLIIIMLSPYRPTAGHRPNIKIKSIKMVYLPILYRYHEPTNHIIYLQATQDTLNGPG